MNFGTYFVNFILATVAVANAFSCFGFSSFGQSHHVLVDNLTDNDPDSCTELASIEAQSVQIYVLVNRRPINYVRVLGFGLLCTQAAGMNVFTASICQNGLCNTEQCVSLVISEEDQVPACTYRCPSRPRETEYLIVSTVIHNGEIPSICEIFSY